jgi:parallel beta-helix repeat protein
MVVSRSVNMVGGDTWPTGDPYLQRQNEPSVAASTRNPQHLLAGANDYRTVDLPGLSTGPETGDAWLGLFKSFDGGERWQSNLLPGYPQDTSAEGMASPLHGFQAGADPVVRPGTNGLLYFAGLAFNRGDGQPSAVFMSRFIDNNNKENGDPIKYLGTTIIDKSTGADFIDKPWMAVDVPRTGAKSCRIVVSEPPPADMKPGVGWGRFSGWKKHEADKKRKDSDRRDGKDGDKNKGKEKPEPKPSKDPRLVAETIAAGRIYVAYSRITTVTTNGVADITSRIMFSQSDDCGATWTKPVQVSRPQDKVNQGATVAVDPKTGAVFVAWRQFGMTAVDTDAVMVARMAAPGRGFDSANSVHKFNAHRPTDRLRRMIAEHRGGDVDEVAQIQPFDQGSAEDRFRTNAYPTIAIDDDSRAYLAWTERGFGNARSSATEGDARVVVATSRNGAAWSAPRAVDTGAVGVDQPGHQLMPSIAFAAGKLVVVYYDLREDVSRVFGPFISETDAIATVRRRHTIDIRAAYATKGDAPVFGPSVKLSQYLVGSRPGSSQVEQLQYNAPELPLFKLGTVPFMGDYIDLAPAPAFVQDSKGAWTANTAAQAAPVFHVVWTDNRDVRPPADGNWQNYTPVGAVGGNSKFDPTQPVPACQPGQTGMRNQNIYSARLTWGLVAGSPGNTKPLDPNTPRAFVVFAQNTGTTTKTFRFSIPSQPVGGVASFSQTAVAGTAYPLLSVDVSVAPKSMVTRTVYVTSTDVKAQVPVDIKEVLAPNEAIVAGGLASRVLLNPDISNPDISNPDISNPDISNPDISNAEVYNPDISNPDISNPDISNPDISNPDISNPDISNVVVANPDISNPDISNPDISNPDISNPDISNPDISNPDISNGALTDVTWTIVNTGNTTASFNVNLFLANAAAKLGGVKTQLVVHKTYSTPIAAGCSLKQQTQTVLVANVPNPTFYEPGTSAVFNPADPSVTNTTLWLEPGGEGKITLRIIDPNPQDGITIDPVHDVTPVVTANPVNTTDLGTPTPPPSTTPPPTPNVTLLFTAQPTDTAVNGVIAPISVHAQAGAAPGAGVQVTLAIAINPAGGHLSGTTTLLTDAAGNVTFNGLSIEKAGTGYRLSASASASGAVPDLSVPFNIGAPPPPPPPAGWVAAGNGIVTLLNDGLVGGTPQMTYQYNGDGHNGTIGGDGPYSGAWTFSTVATAAGPVHLDWEWTGFHSYFASQARLEVFINRGGGDVSVTQLLQVGPTFDCHEPCTGFTYNGATVPVVQVGDTYGFRLYGSHFDAGEVLQGTFGVIVNGATSPSPFVVTNAADSGAGSLRAAILAADAAPGTNTISFAIPGPWVHTIAPSTPLPTLSQAMVVDGLTQPGAASMAPKINLDGRILAATGQAGVNLGQAPGLEVVTSNVTLRGLSINRFPGPGVYLNNGTSNVHVEDGTIGVAPEGLNNWPVNNIGIQVNGSINSVIANNVISSNAYSGIVFSGGSGSTVSGNRIGLSADGLTAMPNGDNGITMFDGTNGTIIDANFISGNGSGGNGFGIDLQNSGGPNVANTSITRNTIGLDVNGNLLTRVGQPGVQGNAGGGIRIRAAFGTLIGGAAAGNVISGNTGAGIQVIGPLGGVPTTIKANVIGADPTGVFARGNTGVGISVDSTAVEVTMLANVIFGNGGLAIQLNGAANNAQAAPLVNMAGNLLGQAHTLADVTLTSPSGAYLYQFFAGSSCGAAQSLLAEATLSEGRHVVDLGSLVPVSTWITVTATDASGDTSQLSGCQQVTAPSVSYSATTGHYYQYVTNPLTQWDDANTAANAATFAGLSGHLATITSAAEQTVVHDLYLQMGLGDMRAWIGLKDQVGNGTWGWVTGEPFAYSNWGGGEPNNIGSELWVEFFASGSWNNNVQPNFAIQGYVIEYQ